MDKTTLRKQALAHLQSITAEQRHQASSRACELLAHSSLWKNSNGVMLFASLKSEIDTQPLINQAWHEGKKVYLPYFTQSATILEPKQVQTHDDLSVREMGIAQPNPTQCPTGSWENIDLVLVPGLLFDQQGNRLGRGKGFYDKTLSHLKHAHPNIMHVGYFYASQQSDVVPTEPHDQQLQIIVTDQYILDLRVA